MKLVNSNVQKVLIQLLKEGQSVDVPASGMSMFPLLMPGDILCVEPRPPKIGEIGVFMGSGLLIAHRLISIRNKRYFFKGDGLISPDSPTESTNVFGTVIKRKRGINERSCTSGIFFIFNKVMPILTNVTGRFFFYLGRVYVKL